MFRLNRVLSIPCNKLNNHSLTFLFSLLKAYLVLRRGPTTLLCPDCVYHVPRCGPELHPAQLQLVPPVQPVGGTQQGGVCPGHLARAGLGQPGDEGSVHSDPHHLPATVQLVHRLYEVPPVRPQQG